MNSPQHLICSALSLDSRHLLAGSTCQRRFSPYKRNTMQPYGGSWQPPIARSTEHRSFRAGSDCVLVLWHRYPSIPS